MTLKTARVGKKNRAQVAAIPLGIRPLDETKDVIPSPRPVDWALFLASDVRASDDFMAGIEDLPIQQRNRE